MDRWNCYIIKIALKANFRYYSKSPSKQKSDRLALEIYKNRFNLHNKRYDACSFIISQTINKNFRQKRTIVLSTTRINAKNQNGIFEILVRKSISHVKKE